MSGESRTENMKQVIQTGDRYKHVTGMLCRVCAARNTPVPTRAWSKRRLSTRVLWRSYLTTVSTLLKRLSRRGNVTFAYFTTLTMASSYTRSPHDTYRQEGSEQWKSNQTHYGQESPQQTNIALGPFARREAKLTLFPHDTNAECSCSTDEYS